MADAIQSISSGLFNLKTYFEGPIVSQFNDDSPILRSIEKVTKGWSGLQVNRPLKTRRNQGVGATSDNGILPAIGRQSGVQAVIQAKFNYLRFGITGPMIKASQSDQGSFVRQASYEIEEGYKDLKAEVSRQLSWDGSGTLATVNANVVASTTIVLRGREATEPALKFLDVGSNLDLVSGGALTSFTSVTILAITSGGPNSATATVVVDTPVTATAGDVFVRSGSFGQEIQGLLTALDGNTTTIYGVNRATAIQYQGNVRDAGAGPLSLDLMNAAYNDAERRSSDSVKALWTDYESHRFYVRLLTPDKRYANTVEGDGGFAKAGKRYTDFNGIPVVPDKDCPTRMFFISPETWKNYVLCEMDFAQESGSIYIPQASTDAYEARLRYFTNLFPEQPNANAVIRNYTSP